MKRTMWLNRRGLLRALLEGGLFIEAETNDDGLWLRWEFRPREVLDAMLASQWGKGTDG